MTTKQLRELMNYHDLEPFGEYRDELRHGSMMALHLNLNRDLKAKPEPWIPLDCMNFVSKPPEKIYTPEELEAYATKVIG